MWCYCTPSLHHNCTTNIIKCNPMTEHCVIGKSGSRITQSCWEWTTTNECPLVIGPCYLIGDNFQRPACCCKGNLCNDKSVEFTKHPLKVIQTITSITSVLSVDKSNYSSYWIYLLPIFCFVVFLSLFLTVLSKKYSLWHKIFNKAQSKNIKSFHQELNTNVNNSKGNSSNFESSKLLNRISLETNLYCQCNKNKLIAYGRFGQVWSGLINTENPNNEKIIAIKIFSNNIEGKKSWENELLIYSMLRNKPHPNILYFYGAEKIRQNINSEFWLVVEYYPLGSLWEYLNRTTVTWKILLKICHNIADGLSHLHNFASPINSPIAHRDIKSKNILLKTDLTACIADFGLAICEKNCKSSFNNMVGTLNYMAPEILEGSINFDIYSFLRIDVFSMSLVFWEVLNRCQFPGVIVSEFQVPFQNLVGEKPTLKELQYCVTNKKLRPQFNPFWSRFPKVLLLWKTITECWDEDPDARLNAECVLRRLEVFSQTCDLD